MERTPGKVEKGRDKRTWWVGKRRGRTGRGMEEEDEKGRRIGKGTDPLNFVR